MSGPNNNRWISLYGLLLPTALFLMVFVVYPNAAVFLRSFYHWVPGLYDEFVGLQNFRDLWADPMIWQSFELVGVLLISNVFKIIPSIAVAIVLNRLISERWRTVYRGLFVIPFVVPTLVWLLLWKSFYDPTYGVINRMLQATGMMRVLAFLDGTPEDPGLIPTVGGWVRFGVDHSLQPLLGSIWALALAGWMLQRLSAHTEDRTRHRAYGLLLVLAAVPQGMLLLAMAGWPPVLVLVVVPVLCWALQRCIGGLAFGWLMLLIAGAFLFRDQPVRLPLLLAMVFALKEWLLTQFHHYKAQVIARRTALGLVLAGLTIGLGGSIWMVPTGEFTHGQPAWLGHEQLVLPAIILWGFPWVGTIGVLIYLAGLQQIPRNVFESARMEGVGPMGMVWHVELPMILTQVRIHLVLLTLGTLTQYEFFLLLLGTEGGPNGRGMVPGLYMFRRAFESSEFGYAAAIGVVMFFAILILTMIYTRFLKSHR